MGFPLTVDSRGTFYLDEIGASKNFHTRRSNYWRKGGFHEPLATQRKPNVSSELEILAILRVRNQNPSRDRLNSTRKLKRIWNFTEKKIEHIFSIGWIKFSPIGRGDANFFNPPVEGAWSSSSCTRSSPRLFFHAIDPRGSSFRDARATRDTRPRKFTLVKETSRRGFSTRKTKIVHFLIIRSFH